MLLDYPPLDLSHRHLYQGYPLYYFGVSPKTQLQAYSLKHTIS